MDKKILIVYYSRTGATKKVAEILREKLNCDSEEIIDTKNRSGALGYIMSGRDAMKKKLTKLQPLKKNVADYDLVIIGTPTWVYTLSTPIRTFISENKEKIKSVAIFYTMGGEMQRKLLPKLKIY